MILNYIIGGQIGTVLMTAIMMIAPKMGILLEGYMMIPDGLGGMLDDMWE